MKNQKSLLTAIMFIFIVCNITAQGIEDKMFSASVDFTRLFEKEGEFDKGLDIVLKLTLDKDTKIEKVLTFEAFPNIDFYKLGLGANYVVRIDKKKRYRFIELAAGIEGGVIYRKNLPRKGSKGQIYDRKSFSGWLTYAINLEVRYFITDNVALIMTNNSQMRNDFKIYGDKAVAKFVNSNHAGIAFVL